MVGCDLEISTLMLQMHRVVHTKSLGDLHLDDGEGISLAKTHSITDGSSARPMGDGQRDAHPLIWNTVTR